MTSRLSDSGQADHSSTRHRTPPVWFLAMCTASAVVGLTLLTPTLPLIKTELDVSSEAVQLLLSAYLFALAVGQLFCGPLSDKTGRRPVMLVGALLFSVAGVVAMFTHSIEALVVLRFFQGLGAAACMSMGRAIVNDVYAREDAARKMSTISTILAIAPALSLAFGGVLAESAGWQGAMAVLAASGVLVFAAAIRVADETHFHRVDKINVHTVASAYLTVLRNRRFLCWSMAGGMQIGIFFSLNAFLAYQYQRHGYSMTEFGLWFALTPAFYIVGNTLNRLWFVSRGIEPTALLGSLLSLLSVILLFATQALGYTHALSIALPCCLFGFGNGIIVANTTVGAISSAGKHGGTGTGIVGAWQMATGGIAGAVIVSLGGAQVFSIAAGVLMVMSLISVASMLYVFSHRGDSDLASDS
ncbi:MAG: multidrug effflux MFS transporter [Granulosicoccus sp.]